MSTNIYISKSGKEQKGMKKSLLEILNESKRSIPETPPLRTLRKLNKEKKLRPN